MGLNSKLKFEVKNRFQPCFNSQFPLVLSKNEHLICGRANENSIDINIISGKTFEPIRTVKDDDGITSFVVNAVDSTLLFSTRSLLLKQVDVSTLNVIKSWKSCHQRPVLKMALNSSSTRLATGSGDTVVRLWHIGPREGFCASFRGHSGMITLLQFHPDHGFLFSSALGDFYVAVWDSEIGKRIATLDGHQASVTDIAFGRNESRSFATCGRDKVIIIWSCPEFHRQAVIATFESLETCVFLPKGALVNHLGDVVNDEELLLTGGQWGCLRVWNTQTTRCVLEIKGPLDRMAQDQTTQQKNRESTDYGLHSVVSLQLAQVASTEYGDSGLRLVLARQSNHIEFYNPLTAKLISECLGDIGQVDQLCLVGRAHNHLLLADASPQLKLFLQPYGSRCREGETGGCSWRCHLVPGGHTDVITDMSVSACGSWAITGSKDQSVCCWRLVEPDMSVGGSPVNTNLVLVERIQNAHATHLCALALNRSTTTLLSASEDNVLKVWSLNFLLGEQPSSSSPPRISEVGLVPNAHSSYINCIDVSVNDQFAATASRDKTVKIWKFANCSLECFGVLRGHRRGVWSVRFSTREKIVLTASGDGDIRLWNLKDLSCIRTLEGHEQPVYKAVFLSQERQVLSCDQSGLVRLWDLNKPSSAETSSPGPNSPDIGGSSRTFEAHKGRIWSLVVRPDETGFYTGGEDETLCYFQDVTQEIQEESAKKSEDFIQTQQALENLVKDHRMSEALRLAVKLDQPKRTLDILQNLMLNDGDDRGDTEKEEETSNKHQLQQLQSNSLPCQFAHVAAALNDLVRLSAGDPSPPSDPASSDCPPQPLVQRLLGYAVNWNTRAGTCVVAQVILNWVLTRWSPKELLRWPGVARIVESLLPYTARHYQRISRLDEQLAVVDFLCDLADEHMVTVLDETDAPLVPLETSLPASPSALVDLNVENFSANTSVDANRITMSNIIVPEF